MTLSTIKTFPNEDNWRDISGLLTHLTEEPTYTPRTIAEQVILVTAGGSTSAYFYDDKASSWKSAAII